MVVVCLLTPDNLKIVSAELITLALLMKTKDLALMKCQHSLIPTDQSGWLPKAKPYHHLQVKTHKLNKTMTGPFVESPDNFSGPESCFMSAVFALKRSKFPKYRKWYNDRFVSYERRYYRVFSHDITAAIFVSQNNETAAMLVSQTNLLGVILFSYANPVFCCDKFA